MAGIVTVTEKSPCSLRLTGARSHWWPHDEQLKLRLEEAERKKEADRAAAALETEFDDAKLDVLVDAGGKAG